MEFDLIISNPPYNKNLDLKILKEIYELSDKICFVHPGIWLLDNKNVSKIYASTKDLIKEDFAYNEEIKNSNEIFSIGLFQNTFINLFSKNSERSVDLEDIDVHGKSQIYKSIKQKILSYCSSSNVQQKIVHENSTKHECGFSGIRGHYNNPDLYTFIQTKNEAAHVGKSTRYFMKVLFETKEEAINFREYLKLQISCFCLSIYKLNQHLDAGELQAVPFMPSYKSRWSNELVAKEIGLSHEEIQWILDWLPPYYETIKS